MRPFPSRQRCPGSGGRNCRLASSLVRAARVRLPGKAAWQDCYRFECSRIGPSGGYSTVSQDKPLEQVEAPIDSLEHESEVDRAHIRALLEDAAADREEIGNLLTDALIDKAELQRLIEAGFGDRAQISRLLAEQVDDQSRIDQLVAEIGAEHEEIEHLRSALNSSRVIGAAVGVVMERYDVDRETAFRFLGRVSQERNRKLRDIAAEIVEGTGSSP